VVLVSFHHRRQRLINHRTALISQMRGLPIAGRGLAIVLLGTAAALPSGFYSNSALAWCRPLDLSET
jgi:hypothetical protein